MSILFMINNSEHPKSLIIHKTEHGSENKQQIAKPSQKCHVVRPSSQDHPRVYCSTKPKCWTARNEDPAAFHILPSCQHGKVTLFMLMCCCHPSSLVPLFPGAVWLNWSLFQNPSQHRDPSLQLLNTRAVTTVELECGCKSCFALSVLYLFSPSSVHVKLITDPVSCAVPNALQNEYSSIPNHSLLLKIDVCHCMRHFPLVIFCNFLWNGSLYQFPTWQFYMKNAHCSQQILILTMF